MTVELMIRPADEAVAEDLRNAEGWDRYESALRELLADVLGGEDLTIERMVVNFPLPEQYAHLRNGASIDLPTALDLVPEMLAGEGPFGAIITPDGIDLTAGWDGAVFLLLAAKRELPLSPQQEAALAFQWRDPPLVSLREDGPLITAAADEAFWTKVESAAASVAPQPTLLAERWVHGYMGLRWFIVTTDNAQEVARKVEPRSLLSVIVAPDPDPDPGLLEDGYREAVIGNREFKVLDSALARWQAVVPDADGVVRGRWEAHEGETPEQ